MYNLLWVGLLIGVPVGAFAPGWVKPIVFVIALVLSDLVRTTSHNGRSVHFAVSPVLIGAIGVGFGLWALHWARRRGLQQLGRAELNTRWNAVRGISRWGW
jgi:hypothetical protein